MTTTSMIFHSIFYSFFVWNLIFVVLFWGWNMWELGFGFLFLFVLESLRWLVCDDDDTNIQKYILTPIYKPHSLAIDMLKVVHFDWDCSVESNENVKLIIRNLWNLQLKWWILWLFTGCTQSIHVDRSEYVKWIGQLLTLTEHGNCHNILMSRNECVVFVDGSDCRRWVSSCITLLYCMSCTHLSSYSNWTALYHQHRFVHTINNGSSSNSSKGNHHSQNTLCIEMTFPSHRCHLIRKFSSTCEHRTHDMKIIIKVLYIITQFCLTFSFLSSALICQLLLYMSMPFLVKRNPRSNHLHNYILLVSCTYVISTLYTRTVEMRNGNQRR